MTVSLDLQRVYRDHLEYIRRWGLLGVLAAYRQLDPDDLARTFPPVARLATAVYGAAVIEALTTTDEYMALVAGTAGGAYVADWRRGRPEAPRQINYGRDFATWMRGGLPGMLSLMARGMDVTDAIDVSQARTAQIVATQPLQYARSTTWSRFIVDSLIAQDNVPPAQLRPWTDEVETYANLWDGQRVRDYPGRFERWQRVPSPGACGFCLMLATRTDYTSADAAMYAGGSEGTIRRTTRRNKENRLAGVFRRRTSSMESGERYHRSCRCTVRMVPMGGPAAISEEDYLRLSRRDPVTGELPTFGIGALRYNIESFEFDIVDAGVAMPQTAPWKDAWRAAPRKRGRRASTSVNA